MAKPFSFQTLFGRSGKSEVTLPDLNVARPKGVLIWLHVSERKKPKALAQLMQRLETEIDAQFLVTYPPEVAPHVLVQDYAICTVLPMSSPRDIEAFLDHWQPDYLIWAEDALHPAPLVSAKARGIPMVWVDAIAQEKPTKKRFWLPSTKPETVRFFDKLYARNEDAQKALSQDIRDDTRLIATGALAEETPVLECNADDLEALSETLVARPCWLAARVTMEELNTILRAQRGISRLSPRILLILVADAAKDAQAMFKQCRREGFHIASWDDGQLPNEKTDILLAENHAELGLFYRVAPITFMASSLMKGSPGHTPLEPAALGSAVLHGPSTPAHQKAYKRLARAGAAQVVLDAQDIVETLEELMAPDKVALMVHAGWETVSQGAGVINQIVTDAAKTLSSTEGQA